MAQVFQTREAQRAQNINVYDHILSDEDFNNSYLTFNRRVAETFSMLLAGIWAPIRWLFSLFFSGGVGGGISAGAVPVVGAGAGAGGISNRLRQEEGTKTLDPAPLRDMYNAVINHSTPEHEDSFLNEQYLNDFNKLKKYVEQLIPGIAAYGISPAVAQKYLFDGVVNTKLELTSLTS
jgi:hypothetical protein